MIDDRQRRGGDGGRRGWGRNDGRRRRGDGRWRFDLQRRRGYYGRLRCNRSRRGGTPDDAVADLVAALLRAFRFRRPGGCLLADGLVGVAVEPARPEVTVLGGRGLLVDPGLVRLRPGADARRVVVPVVVLVARVEAAGPRRLVARRSGTGGRQRNAGAGRRCPSNRLLSRGRALGTITEVREGDAPPRHRTGFREAVELHARAGAACQKACQKTNRQPGSLVSYKSLARLPDWPRHRNIDSIA